MFRGRRSKESPMPVPQTIERRAVVAAAALLLCAPVAGLAQTAKKSLRIGILVGDTRPPHEEQALLEGLREQGFADHHGRSHRPRWPAAHQQHCLAMLGPSPPQPDDLP